ncbi:MAG: sensor histidine kinase [Desulfobacterales bacterium]|nr:sensor histidine kinase [Desulfobacterales bacterium]
MAFTFKDKVSLTFWDHQEISSGPYRSRYNLRSLWKQTVMISILIVLIPLIGLTCFDYTITEEAYESEIMLRTSRFVSNIRRTIAFFLSERSFALNFIIQDNTYEELSEAKRLSYILNNLKQSLGGFTDLGVIDQTGKQHTYVGPYAFKDLYYKDAAWFKQVVHQGNYISDVFKGYRNAPHLVVAIKKELPNGGFFILRSSLDNERFNEMLSHLEISGLGDAFLVNEEGILQTPSRLFGDVLQLMPLPVPKPSVNTEVLEMKNAKTGNSLFVGYTYISDTPYILMVVMNKQEALKPWHTTRIKLISVLIATVIIILLVILIMVTYLVNNIFLADRKRAEILHHVEYSNKMASIGRMAAGVAHEINNPLAIINEKAGLIMDLFTYRDEYTKDGKLLELIKSIISSVERCAVITKRLLSFARNIDVSVFQPIRLKEFVFEVLGFLGKEAEYRSIQIDVSVAEDIDEFLSDKGKLQQIFLNLFNNSMAALYDGGRLEINAVKKNKETILITIADSGCGISEKDLKRIFEPFFTTKRNKGGTGLGLSITYNLVQELGGNISVESKVDEGTRFSILLPYKLKNGS